MAGNVLGGVLYEKLIIRSTQNAIFKRFHIQTLESGMANNILTRRLEIEICSGNGRPF